MSRKDRPIISVTALKHFAADPQHWAVTLPPRQPEADVLVAWTYLHAPMLPAAGDHETEYHRQLREQFEMTDDDLSAEGEKLNRELGADVAEVRR